MSLASILGGISRKLDAAALAGKDYLTQKEAAAYCGVSLSQFQAKAEFYGIKPFEFMGKQQYSKARIRDLMKQEEHGWGTEENQNSTRGESPTTSSGGNRTSKQERAKGKECRSGKYRKDRLRLLSSVKL